MKRVFVSVIFMALLASCTFFEEPLGLNDFRESWESAKSNSAVSFYVIDVSEYHYVIEERYPLKKHRFKLSKDKIEIVLLKSDSSALKNYNVKFKSPNS